MRNDETMGTFEYDGLIIDGSHSLDVKGITIASGQGKLHAALFSRSEQTRKR